MWQGRLPRGKGEHKLLACDLYHYPEERTLDRVPTFEFDAKKTRETRAAIEAFLKKSDAQLWIQHDLSQRQAQEGAKLLRLMSNQMRS